MRSITKTLLRVACAAILLLAAVGVHNVSKADVGLSNTALAVRAAMDVEFSSQNNPETWIARLGMGHDDVEAGFTIESREYNLYGFYINFPMADWIRMDNAVFLGNGERWKVDSKVDAYLPHFTILGPFNLTSYLEGTLEDAAREKTKADGKWGLKIGNVGPFSFYAGAGLLFSNRDSVRTEGFIGAEAAYENVQLGVRGHYVEGKDGIEVLSNMGVSF